MEKFIIMIVDHVLIKEKTEFILKKKKSLLCIQLPRLINDAKSNSS